MFVHQFLGYRFVSSSVLRKYIPTVPFCLYNTQQQKSDHPSPNPRKEYYTSNYKSSSNRNSNTTNRYKEQTVPKYVSLEERQKQDTTVHNEKLQLKKIQSGIHIRELQSLLSSIPALQTHFLKLKSSVADQLGLQNEKTYSNELADADRTSNLVIFLRTHFEKFVNAWSLQMQEQLQALDVTTDSETIKASLEKQNELAVTLSIKLLSYCVHEIGASITNFDFVKIISIYEVFEKNWIYHFLQNDTLHKEWISQQLHSFQELFNQSFSTYILSLDSSFKAAEFVYLQLLNQRKLRISELKTDSKDKQVQSLQMNGLIPNASVFGFFFHIYAKQGQTKTISRLIYEMKKVFHVAPNIDIYMATILLCLEQGAEEQAMRVLDFILQNKQQLNNSNSMDKKEYSKQRIALLRNVFYRFLTYFIEKKEIEKLELLIDKFVMIQEFETQVNFNVVISTGVLNALLNYCNDSKESVTLIMQMAKEFDIQADGKTAELLKNSSFGKSIVNQVYGMKMNDFEKVVQKMHQER